MQKYAVFKSLKINRQLRSWLLIWLVVLANALAFYSAAMAAGGTPSGPPNPLAQTSNTSDEGSDYVPPTTTKPPNTGANSIPKLGNQSSLENTAQQVTAPAATGSTNLVTEVAEQPDNTVATNDNLNTPINMSGSGSSAGGSTTGGAVQPVGSPGQPYRGWFTSTSLQTENVITGYNPKATWQSVANTLSDLTQTSPTRGSTTGWSAPFFEALQAMWYYTIGGGWVPKLGWLVGKFIQDFVSKWLGPAIGKFLLVKMVAFKDNPDVSFQSDEFSIQMRSWFHLVRDFSYDLLLLFFIISIWRYWSNAVWGNGRLWGAVGRLIFATAAVIAWPQIYHYSIMIGNSANDIFIQQLSQNPDQLGQAVWNWIAQGVQFRGTQEELATGANPPLWIPFTWVIELIVNLAIAIAMFISLLAFFVEKAIQLTIIVMAYIFAPFFLVCLASEDTERYASDFLKVFYEATCWNFIWGGLTALLVFTINMGSKPDNPIYMLSAAVSNQVTNNPDNPWFSSLLILGIMQAMLQVPHYVSSGHFGAKAGILELGFASWMGKRAVSKLWGTNGLYTQMRHAWGDQKSHRWGLDLPTKGLNLSRSNANLQAGENFGRTNLPLTPLASSAGGGYGGGAGGPGGGAGGPGGGPGGPSGGGYGGGGYAGGGYSGNTIVTPEDNGIGAPVRAHTDVDTLNGRQSPTSRVADMMQRTRLFGDFFVDHEGGTDKKARFTFEQMGGVDDIIMPKNASKEEKALTWAAAQFVNVVDEKGHIDPGFEDALWVDKVNASARMGGPLNPLNPYGLYGQVQPTLLDKFALWLDDGKMSLPFKDIMGFRQSRWNNKMIVRGVNDYINGKKGSAVAGYWEARRGKFDAAQQVYRLTNPSARAGGVNPMRLEAISSLQRNNVESNRTTRTAGSHPAILRIKSNERGEYVQSVVRLLQESAVSHFGENNLRQMMSEPTGADYLINFYDGVMNHIPDDYVHATAAIARNHGIQYVTPGNVHEVVKEKRSRFASSLDKRDFDSAARNVRLQANYHPYVGELKW